MAAENLRQLNKAVERQSKLTETKATLKVVEGKRKAAFGQDSDSQIRTKIQDLHAHYCVDKATTTDAVSRCKELTTALDTRIAESSADLPRYVALRDVAELDLKRHVDAVRSASLELLDTVEPLISEKLEVLQSTGVFVNRLGSETEVKCPACGQRIPVDRFQAHIAAERDRLGAMLEVYERRKAAIGALRDTVTSLKSTLAKADVTSWRREMATGPLADNVAYLDGINTDALVVSCGEGDLEAFEGKLLPLINVAASASKDAPPDARQLVTDKQVIEAGSAVMEAAEQVRAVERADALVSFINALEQGIRQEIRLRSQVVIDEISAAIQEMWAILHPGEAIEDVRLYLPDASDKAIDIGLTFYGVDQESPRLTLSEGYRNSLGLCIFLAMANRDADKDRPLFLDDVVVSMDRNHRGMIVELLDKEFGGRQVVILTHDREWYTELRHQLDVKDWVFGTLLPYETPDLGIRWSHKTTTFGDARAHLSERPDSAGNDARKIMDVECALIAERLRIRLPYLRADKNDKRMAHDFLERFVADGGKCLQKRVGEDHKVHSDAIDALRNADRLLISWGNRASHSFNVVRPEASKLIDACEEALEFFKCESCGKSVWFADSASSESVQCQCGEMRWRYGKG